MPVLPNFRLEAYLSQWEFTARYHMTASDAESLTLADLLSLADTHDQEAFERIWLGYLPPAGMSELREVISSTYETITGEDVLCFAGGGEALYVAMNTLLNSEDHAVVITPAYQSAETLAVSLCATTGVALDPELDWQLDLNQLRKAIRPNTKLVAINYPNNPTGKILDREEFDGLIEICREHGLWLLSDEVFRLVESDPVKRLPQAVDSYERGLSLNVMSKVYGLPGLRVGWIATKDRDLVQRMERLKHYLSICNSAPSEALAIIALKARARILERNRTLIAANLLRLDEFFADYPALFEWKTPDGGMVGYPRYKGPDGVETFVRRLVEEANVLLLPASIFQSDLSPTPPDRFRIGYGRSHVAAGLEVMREWLERQEMA